MKPVDINNFIEALFSGNIVAEKFATPSNKY
jgi:hypothetical protein